MKQLKIQKPCTENWEEMSPTQKGAFCMKCSTQVHDFSNQSPEEIRSTLVAFKGQEVCGRITNTQLDSLNDDYQAWRVSNSWSIQRASFYAFLFVFGLMMVSCNNQQDEQQIIQLQEKVMTLVVDKDDKEKIEKITPLEIKDVQQTLERPEEIFLGEMAIPADYKFVETPKCLDSMILPERTEYTTITMGMMVASHAYVEHIELIETADKRDEFGEIIPTTFNALAFPNPTQGRTTLKFEVPQSTHASFELYNMNGQRIKSMGAAEYEPGTHEIPFDLSQLKTGTYLIGILSKEYKEMVRVVKI